jgi:hypothetical protein
MKSKAVLWVLIIISQQKLKNVDNVQLVLNVTLILWFNLHHVLKGSTLIKDNRNVNIAHQENSVQNLVQLMKKCWLREPVKLVFYV